MAVLMGRDGLLNIGASTWKVHSWTVQEVRPLSDATGDNATVTEYEFGDPTIRGSMDISLTDASAATKKLPRSGTTITDAVFTTVSGTTYTVNIKIFDVQYAVNKRNGGPPQRVRCSFVSDDNSAGSFLNPS